MQEPAEQKIDSRKVDARKIDSRKVDARKVDSKWIEQQRPDVARPLPGQTPLGVIDEFEAEGSLGSVVPVRTIFLRGSECRFRCTMCDLWQHTHVEPTAAAAIVEQIRIGLAEVSPSSDSPQSPRWLKLYNASNFFDSKNIPTSDHPGIASQVASIDRVIVENHPRLLPWSKIDRFRNRLRGRLEIAMGLESVEPDILRRLNKQMTVDDFATAARACRQHDIDVRAFVLLQPPWQNEEAAFESCFRTVSFAIDLGVRHISIIPTRPGNGALDRLREQGHFRLPRARALERLCEAFIDARSSIVCGDTWDWEKLKDTCPLCSDRRRARLERMNLSRVKEPLLACEHCDTLIHG